MRKRIIFSIIIFILFIIVILLLIFLSSKYFVANKDLNTLNVKNEKNNITEFENINKIVIEYHDLSQHKILKSVEIININEIDTLTNMIKDYEIPPEHIKLHVDGKYVVKMPDNITISFDNLDNAYVKYENDSFSDIVSILPEFKTILVNILVLN